ncbi:MAG: hypothetical protein O6940_13490 [Ignavibacteria bacterium]|nr:hypothetical protein [Ignavibacteria bacterium]
MIVPAEVYSQTKIFIIKGEKINAGIITRQEIAEIALNIFRRRW